MTGSVSDIQGTSRPLGEAATGRILFQGTFIFFELYGNVLLIWLEISRPSTEILKTSLLFDNRLYNRI